MTSLCAECGHPATSNEPWCDDVSTTSWGEETCGCSQFTKDTDD